MRTPTFSSLVGPGISQGYSPSILHQGARQHGDCYKDTLHVRKRRKISPPNPFAEQPAWYQNSQFEYSSVFGTKVSRVAIRCESRAPSANFLGTPQQVSSDLFGQRAAGIFSSDPKESLFKIHTSRPVGCRSHVSGFFKPDEKAVRFGLGTPFPDFFRQGIWSNAPKREQSPGQRTSPSLSHLSASNFRSPLGSILNKLRSLDEPSQKGLLALNLLALVFGANVAANRLIDQASESASLPASLACAIKFGAAALAFSPVIWELLMGQGSSRGSSSEAGPSSATSAQGAAGNGLQEERTTEGRDKIADASSDNLWLVGAELAALQMGAILAVHAKEIGVPIETGATISGTSMGALLVLTLLIPLLELAASKNNVSGGGEGLQVSALTWTTTAVSLSSLAILAVHGGLPPGGGPFSSPLPVPAGPLFGLVAALLSAAQIFRAEMLCVRFPPLSLSAAQMLSAFLFSAFWFVADAATTASVFNGFSSSVTSLQHEPGQLSSFSQSLLQTNSVGQPSLFTPLSVPHFHLLVPLSLSSSFSYLEALPWVPLVFSGLVAGGAASLLEFHALRTVHASSAALVYSSIPVWGALLASSSSPLQGWLLSPAVSPSDATHMASDAVHLAGAVALALSVTAAAAVTMPPPKSSSSATSRSTGLLLGTGEMCVTKQQQQQSRKRLSDTTVSELSARMSSLTIGDPCEREASPKIASVEGVVHNAQAQVLSAPTSLSSSSSPLQSVKCEIGKPFQCAVTVPRDQKRAEPSEGQEGSDQLPDPDLLPGVMLQSQFKAPYYASQVEELLLQGGGAAPTATSIPNTAATSLPGITAASQIAADTAISATAAAPVESVTAAVAVSASASTISGAAATTASSPVAAAAAGANAASLAIATPVATVVSPVASTSATSAALSIVFPAASSTSPVASAAAITASTTTTVSGATSVTGAAAPSVATNIFTTASASDTLTISAATYAAAASTTTQAASAAAAAAARATGLVVATEGAAAGAASSSWPSASAAAAAAAAAVSSSGPIPVSSSLSSAVLGTAEAAEAAAAAAATSVASATPTYIVPVALPSPLSTPSSALPPTLSLAASPPLPLSVSAVPSDGSFSASDMLFQLGVNSYLDAAALEPAALFSATSPSVPDIFLAGDASAAAGALCSSLSSTALFLASQPGISVAIESLELPFLSL